MSAAQRATADVGYAALRSEQLFREVNEQIVMLDDATGALDLVCECGDDRCFERVTVGPADYERLRGFPSRFVVRPGHVSGDGERVVEESAAYVVVEKTGAAAAAAIRSDPRRRLRSTERRRRSS